MPMVSVRHELTGRRYDTRFGAACNDNVLDKVYEEQEDQFNLHAGVR